MIVEVTIHDGMCDLRPNVVGSGHLRQTLWARLEKIYCQEIINGLELGGMVKFEFKRCYKTQRVAQQTTFGHLRIEKLSRALSIESQAIIETLSSQVTEYDLYMMTATKDGLGIEKVTVGKATQTPMVEDVA